MSVEQNGSSSGSSSNGVVPANSNSSAVASSSSSASTKASIQPSEVGWLFVPQYYTFLNQNPDRLHCFYTKKSTLIHGTEQEDEKPCFGQQEIHNKVVSLGFEDCKVYVSNVDSQSSAQGGIIIQVLGEMSNKAGPWKKFAQTFFLAEQPNGYFVLNDIFRYLKDEEETEEQAEEIDADVQKDEAEAREEGRDVAGAKVDISAIAQPDAVPHVQPVITQGGEARKEPVAAIADATNDIHIEDNDNGKKEVVKEVTPAAPAVETVAAPAEAAKQETAPAAAKAAANKADPESAASKPAAAPAAAAAAAAPAVTVAPSGPPKPKTWANLVASNDTAWAASHVRSDARGVSSAAPAVSTSRQQQQPAPTTGGQSRKNTPSSTGSNTSASVFVKSVQAEHVSETSLRTALSTFGSIKEVQLLPNRGCAFVDFTSVDAANKAISTSSSRGGIVVGEKGWKVQVEEKRRTQGGGGQGGQGGKSGGGARKQTNRA